MKSTCERILFQIDPISTEEENAGSTNTSKEEKYARMIFLCWGIGNDEIESRLSCIDSRSEVGGVTNRIINVRSTDYNLIEISEDCFQSKLGYDFDWVSVFMTICLAFNYEEKNKMFCCQRHLENFQVISFCSL